MKKCLIILIVFLISNQFIFAQALVYKDYLVVETDTIELTDLNFGSNLGFSYQVFIPILNAKEKTSYLDEINSCFAANYSSSARIQITLVDMSQFVSSEKKYDYADLYYKAFEYKFSRQKLLDSSHLVFSFDDVARVIKEIDKEGVRWKYLPAKFAELDRSWCLSLVDFVKSE